MHKRQAIRDAIQQRITGLTTTQARVYSSRVYPMSRETLPGIALFAKSEAVLYATQHLPRTQQRTLAVTLEIYVKGIDGYDDEIDTITSEIESAIYEDVTFGGLALDTRVSSLEISFSDGADQPLGAAAMELEIIYITKEGDLEI